MEDRLDAGCVAEAAARWGYAARYTASTGSTNADAAAWARHLAGPGALVVAGHQTAGRGRVGRAWFSIAGRSLLFSLVVRAPGDPALLALVPLAAGVAACDAVRHAGTEARLKWPNDVVAGDRKVAGILCESVAGGPTGWVVVGVGINTGMTDDDLPDGLRATASSIATLTGRDPDRCALLEAWLERFEPLRAALVAGHGAAVLDAYRPLCSTVGRRITATASGRPVEDLAVGIDDAGGLVLAGGAVLRSGDVHHVRPV